MKAVGRTKIEVMNPTDKDAFNIGYVCARKTPSMITPTIIKPIISVIQTSFFTFIFMTHECS